MLDLGLPLDSPPDADMALPAVAGLAAPDSTLAGLIVSHGHPDHHGLVPRADASVPVFIGAAAERILRVAAFWSPVGADLRVAGHLHDRRALRIGPFTVTPYLTDHSAFDSYALLVEAGGRRLFYSGDLRAHGRKARLFEQLVADPPAHVDALLLEGTSVGRGGSTVSEREVEEECVERFRATPGIVLACFSPQNVDRLVTIYRAAKRSGRRLALDLYGAEVARATGREQTIPQAEWDGVAVYAPRSQRGRIKDAGAFERIERVRAQRIFPEQLAAQRDRLVLLFRGSMARELDAAKCLDGAHCAWSMWRGYLDEPSGRRLTTWLAQRGIGLSMLHASGHAPVADLQRLARAMEARRVVPVHTAHPELFPSLFERVDPAADGQWWSV